VTTRQGDDRRLFLALDGLRGVAAVFVAMRHTAFFHSLGIHGGFMAVDLFFVLSGFVIAHAYEQRLAAGLAPGRFLMMRYLRLWPVYALGAVIGLIGAALHTLPGRDNLTHAQVWQTAPYALAMLPGPHIKAMLYPVNSVAWSLALELLINGVYAFAWKPLRDARVLAGVLAASFAALIGAVWWFGRLDIGFTWNDAWGGLPRVAFSFAAGLAVYRLFKMAAWRSGWLGLATLAVLPALLWVRLDEFVFPLACVGLVFPAFVFAAAGAEPGPRLGRLFAWLGAASYPLYALHKPLGEIVGLGVRLVAPRLVQSPLVGAPYLILLMVGALVIERTYDRWARKALTRGVDRAEAWLRPHLGAAGLVIALRLADRRKWRGVVTPVRLVPKVGDGLDRAATDAGLHSAENPAARLAA
jgi:peptidoglycan/LPS O-acetylase OafA/YrhL